MVFTLKTLVCVWLDNYMRETLVCNKFNESRLRGIVGLRMTIYINLITSILCGNEFDEKETGVGNTIRY